MKNSKRKRSSKTISKLKEDEEEKLKLSEEASGEVLLSNLGSVLEDIAKDSKNLENYNDIIKSQSKMPFSSKRRPKISLYDYLKRINSYSSINDSTYIIALMLTDRLCLESSTYITELNVHRLIFTAILIAIKINEDDYYEMTYYAEIAGIEIEELLLLEETFLDLVNFNLYIKEEDYMKYIEYLNSIREE